MCTITSLKIQRDALFVFNVSVFLVNNFAMYIFEGMGGVMQPDADSFTVTIPLFIIFQ